ncbi:hypothetical protein GVX82_03820 [Patescibacteria group bacterium]|jgi:hypothetical protein|nr:hypothetical protein [Patescibacteria group bacterium]
MIEWPRKPANDNKKSTEPIDPTGIEGVHGEGEPTVDELLESQEYEPPQGQDGLTAEDIYRNTNEGEE